MNKKEGLGRRGEDLVCKYLIDNGHTILERNWRSGHLEIDIISLDKVGIHFVEVKSRVAPLQAAPEENVDRVKQRRVTKAAGRYLGHYFADEEIEALLDVAAVTFDGSKVYLDYFEGAYTPTYL